MNYSISIMRVLATIYIVLYHCFCYYGLWIIPDAVVNDKVFYFVPITGLVLNTFVFISGFLFAYLYKSKGKYRDYKSFIINKTRRILIPYIFWGVIVILCLDQPLYSIFNGVSHLWFLLMLFEIFIIARLFIGRLLSSSLLLQIGFVILLILLNSARVRFFGNAFYHLQWTSVLQYIVPFVIGMICYSNNWIGKLNSTNQYMKYLLFTLALTVTIIFSIIQTLPFGSFYHDIPGFILIITTLALIESFSLANVHVCIKSIDKCSIGIYILHHIIIQSILRYVPGTHRLMNEHLIVAPILLFIVVFLISWLATKFMFSNKYAMPIIGA